MSATLPLLSTVALSRVKRGVRHSWLAPCRRIAVVTLMAASLAGCNSKAEHKLRWERLPAIPDAEGFAGSFAGVVDGDLIVAGGANITGDKWAEPLQKTWYDSVFMLTKPGGAWIKRGFKLPRPLGYGVSVTAGIGLACIGGSDGERNYEDCFFVVWVDRELEARGMPPLWKPCANACGALVGDSIYVAGGIETPNATVAMKTFWEFKTKAQGRELWEELESWPGPERMLSVAGSLGDSFYLFGGAKLKPGPDGKPVREYLRDAYRYTPGKGWKRIADMPRAAVAAPSPAIAAGSRLLIISGDDGTKVDFQPVSGHPGFPRDMLAYDTERDVWSVAGEVPFSRATAPVVEWLGRFVIPNGEVRPRVRTPEVWATEAPGATTPK